MTVAYSDTFPVAGGCHCKQLALYCNLQYIWGLETYSVSAESHDLGFGRSLLLSRGRLRDFLECDLEVNQI